MSLELAIKAKIPLIAVTTKDTINLEETLEELCGKKAPKFDLKSDKLSLPKNSFHHVVVAKPLAVNWDVVYTKAVEANATLIIVNPPDMHSAFYNAGVLPTPRGLVYEFLSNWMPEKQANKLIPALGGLSLKEITEVMMLTQARDQSTTSSGIIRTRQMYMNRSQGLDIVNTDNLKGYMPNQAVQLIAKSEKDFFLHEEDYRLRPRGLLAYGDPGTGKSMGAKYLAREWGVPLFRLDATIQSKWTGESEQNLAAALKHVEAEAPAILLFDEVEKMFSRSNDAGTTMKMLGSLLWWLQEHRSRVYTYMTCNSLTDIPPELYRAGRIDKKEKFNLLKEDEAMSLAIIVSKSFPVEDHMDPAAARIVMNGKFVNSDYRLSPSQVNSLVVSAIKERRRGKK